jgi:hypothetical protein
MVVKIEPPNSLLMVSGVALSPKQKYLAVVSVGEGHPHLEFFLFNEVIDIEETNNEEPAKLLFDINPYPGYISIVKWTDDNNIIVETDRMLTYSTGEYNNYSLGFHDSQKYSVNVSTKEITPLTRDAQNPVEYFIKQLDSEHYYLVSDATIALTKLKVITAIPKLEELAKNHEEKCIRQDAEKAVQILKNY